MTSSVLDLSGAVLVGFGPVAFFMPSYIPLVFCVSAADLYTGAEVQPVHVSTVAGSLLGFLPGSPEDFECTGAWFGFVKQGKLSFLLQLQVPFPLNEPHTSRHSAALSFHRNQWQRYTRHQGGAAI